VPAPIDTRPAACPHRARRIARARRARAGISLVESAALISLTGVVLATFTPTFVRHLRSSKIAEAVEELDALHRGVAAYYAAEHLVDGRVERRCLPESAGPVPEHPSPAPQPVDFDDPKLAGADTFRALGQHGIRELRYSYEVRVAAPGCGTRAEAGAPAVVFRATGDLDGDGLHSELEREAAFSSDQSALEPRGPLHVRQRIE
jgi:hypothetical protein